MRTKNGHLGYFTPFIEQLNLSFLFHFELEKLLRMLWASMCRSFVSTHPNGPASCALNSSQTWGLDIFSIFHTDVYKEPIGV